MLKMLLSLCFITSLVAMDDLPGTSQVSGNEELLEVPTNNIVCGHNVDSCPPQVSSDWLPSTARGYHNIDEVVRLIENMIIFPDLITRFYEQLSQEEREHVKVRAAAIRGRSGQKHNLDCRYNKPIDNMRFIDTIFKLFLVENEILNSLPGAAAAQRNQ